MTDDREILEMALAGYALKREAIEREIERVRIMLAVANMPTVGMLEELPRAKREKARKGGRG